MRRWEEILSGADREVVKKSGMGRKQPYGSRPALLIIDTTISFLGQRGELAAASIRTGCGEAGWKAVDNIQKLLETCRANNVPVIFTKNDDATMILTGVSVVKMRKLDPAECEANRIPDDIAPLPSELIVEKTRASVFFGSPLNFCLRAMNVDSLLITGGTTSGCVRASVIDAFSYGYACFVVEECTFDRIQLSHLVNLFDMNAKYADVIPLEEAIKYVTELGSSRKKDLPAKSK